MLRGKNHQLWSRHHQKNGLHLSEALTMLGMLNVQHQCFDKFVPLAKVMGTRHWKRITSMSEMAEKHQQYDLALAVYEACLQPGDHKKFLRKKYNELKRRLRVKE